MKKILSLLLAFTMIISSLAVLTACGDNETPDSNTPTEPPVDRYTVTEEEWLANMESYNFTVNCKNINTDRFDDRTDYSYSTMYLQMSENAVNIVSEQQMYGNYECRKALQLFTADGDFSIYENLYTGEYEAVEIYDNNWMVIVGLFELYGFSVNNETAYYSFNYDEANKCYSFTYTYEHTYNGVVEIQVTTVTVSFLNGVIETIHLEKNRESEGFSSSAIYHLTFTNVGNTTIDIPSYTLVEQ